jgi:hypothetical protein
MQLKSQVEELFFVFAAFLFLNATGLRHPLGLSGGDPFPSLPFKLLV